MPHHLKSLGYFKGKPKNAHEADALVVHCMDFRFQDAFEEFVRKQNFYRGCDHVVLAGGVKDAPEVDWHVELGVELHHIRQVIFINHRTCGAYGPDLAKDPDKELETHIRDLTATAHRLSKKFPRLRIRTLFAEIDEPNNGTSRIEMLEIDWQNEIRENGKQILQANRLATSIPQNL